MPEAAQTDPAQPWWERAFGREYLEVYAHRDDASAAREVAGLLPRLRAAPGPVVDAGCGNGRHLAQLREAGLIACGVDLSRHLLQVAQRRPDCRGQLVRGDMRQPCVAGGLGAVLFLFTAFGYFDDRGNAALLRSWSAILAPGGWLLVDVPNPHAMQRCFQPFSRRTLASGHEVVEKRRLAAGRVIKDITYRGESWSESVRIYDPDEIATMAKAAGLSLVETWPSLCSPTLDEGRHAHWLRRDAAAAG
jgi:SAM-dependent methyltransferase